MKRIFLKLFFIACIAAGLGFRLYDLDRWPMHHDEANQAVKFGELLETGEYRYDPSDHHGPTLYYISLPIVRILTGGSFGDVTESELRLIPACFGLGILTLLLLFHDGIGKESLAFTVMLISVSPAFVYYSRFYIQETLLVFFIAGFMVTGWRYLKSPSFAKAALAGCFAGLVYSTKETGVIAFLSLLMAAWFSGLLRRKQFPTSGTRKHLVIAAVCGIVAAVVLYSSFFSNWSGPLDSVRAYGSYFERAEGAGLHAHPWWYYLRLPAFFHLDGGPIWSEGLVLLLAGIGSAAAVRRRNREKTEFSLPCFIFYYSLISLVAYSAVPYKTPWNLLPFYFGFMILAGFGASVVMAAWKRVPLLKVAGIFFALGMVHLGFQSYRAVFIDYDNPGNPYVYAQTHRDFPGLIRRVDRVAAVSPDRENVLIKVITGPYETWPLPWYLRRYTSVGYWNELDAAGEIGGVPILITTPDMQQELQILSGDGYISEFYQLRPEVFMILNVRRDLWEAHLKSREK